MSRARDDEPYFEARCSDCGEVYHAPDGDCPRCGSANMSYESSRAREYMDWADDERRPWR